MIFIFLWHTENGILLSIIILILTFSGTDRTSERPGASLRVCRALQRARRVVTARQGAVAAGPGQGGHRLLHQGGWPLGVHGCCGHGHQTRVMGGPC